VSLSAFFEAVGVRGFLHAHRLGSPDSLGLDADSPVVLASTVKVPLAYEFARQVAAGLLDPADRVRAAAADRLGGTGSAGFADDVSYSLRDAAFLALSVSDNTAADLLFDRVGVDNVRSLLVELGLTRTSVIGAPRDVLRTIIEDTSAGRPVRALDPLRSLQALRPGRPACTGGSLCALWARGSGHAASSLRALCALRAGRAAGPLRTDRPWRSLCSLGACGALNRSRPSGGVA